MADPHPATGTGVVLICECRPPSINNSTGKGKDRFGKALEASYQAAQPPRLDGLLCGIVCWFVLGYRAGTDPDADNISKAIWDMLSDRQPSDQAGRFRLGAFADDKQVRLRIAGIFDLRADDAGTPAFSELELTGVPPKLCSAWKIWSVVQRSFGI